MHLRAVNHTMPVRELKVSKYHLQYVHNHRYNNRNRDNIALVHNNLQFSCKEPNHLGANFFNNLPNYIKLIEDSTHFKVKIKAHLNVLPLYSFYKLQEIHGKIY